MVTVKGYSNNVNDVRSLQIKYPEAGVFSMNACVPITSDHIMTTSLILSLSYQEIPSQKYCSVGDLLFYWWEAWGHGALGLSLKNGIETQCSLVILVALSCNLYLLGLRIYCTFTPSDVAAFLMLRKGSSKA